MKKRKILAWTALMSILLGTLTYKGYEGRENKSESFSEWLTLENFLKFRFRSFNPHCDKTRLKRAEILQKQFRQHGDVIPLESLDNLIKMANGIPVKSIQKRREALAILDLYSNKYQKNMMNYVINERPIEEKHLKFYEEVQIEEIFAYSEANNQASRTRDEKISLYKYALEFYKTSPEIFELNRLLDTITIFFPNLNQPHHNQTPETAFDHMPPLLKYLTLKEGISFNNMIMHTGGHMRDRKNNNLKLYNQLLNKIRQDIINNGIVSINATSNNYLALLVDEAVREKELQKIKRRTV